VGPLKTTPDLNVTGEFPPYIIPGSEEEFVWRRQHPMGWKFNGQTPQFTSASTDAHKSNIRGNVVELARHIDTNPGLVEAKDQNGWTALHEAVRSQCSDCVYYLLEKGADANALTNDGRSPLHHARKYSKRMTHK